MPWYQHHSLWSMKWMPSWRKKSQMLNSLSLTDQMMQTQPFEPIQGRWWYLQPVSSPGRQ